VRERFREKPQQFQVLAYRGSRLAHSGTGVPDEMFVGIQRREESIPNLSRQLRPACVIDGLCGTDYGGDIDTGYLGKRCRTAVRSLFRILRYRPEHSGCPRGEFVLSHEVLQPSCNNSHDASPIAMNVAI